MVRYRFCAALMPLALTVAAGLLATGACSPTQPSPIVVQGGSPTPFAPFFRELPEGTAVFVPAPTGAAPAGRPEVGHFALDVELGPLAGLWCDQVPEEARTRRYTSSLTFEPYRGLRIDLSDAAFLQGTICAGPGICNRLEVDYDDFREGFLWFSFLDDDAAVVEQLPSGEWLQLSGVPYGRFDSDAMVLTGPMELQFWSGDPVGTSYAACAAAGARVTMTRLQ